MKLNIRLTIYGDMNAYCKQIMQESKGNILVSPLDWGLGHATRMIPFIHELLKSDRKVLIAARGDGALLLQAEFPDITMLSDIPSYDVTYPERGGFSWHFLRDAPRIFGVIRAERDWLDKAIDQYNIEEVYSDNRYGLYNKRVVCHFITHQLYPKMPLLIRGLSGMILNSYIDQFNDILVPDYKGAMSLSGSLSHKPDQSSNIKFIGPLSRFSDKQIGVDSRKEHYTYLAIISGPEPHRTDFEERMISLLLATDEKSLIICGKPGESRDEQIGNVRIVSHIDDEQLAWSIHDSELVICRSGYSTLMDLHALGRRALIVPTPGQTEQEYLAEYHYTAGRHIRIIQKNLDLARITSTRKKINFA